MNELIVKLTSPTGVAACLALSFIAFMSGVILSILGYLNSTGISISLLTVGLIIFLLSFAIIRNKTKTNHHDHTGIIALVGVILGPILIIIGGLLFNNIITLRNIVAIMHEL